MYNYNYIYMYRQQENYHICLENRKFVAPTLDIPTSEDLPAHLALQPVVVLSPVQITQLTPGAIRFLHR